MVDRATFPSDTVSTHVDEFTCQLATLEPPPPEMQQLIGAIHGNQRAMDGFAQMNAGTISPLEFGAVVAGCLLTNV